MLHTISNALVRAIAESIWRSLPVFRTRAKYVDVFPERRAPTDQSRWTFDDSLSSRFESTTRLVGYVCVSVVKRQPRGLSDSEGGAVSLSLPVCLYDALLNIVAE